MGTVLCRV